MEARRIARAGTGFLDGRARLAPERAASNIVRRRAEQARARSQIESRQKVKGCAKKESGAKEIVQEVAQEVKDRAKENGRACQQGQGREEIEEDRAGGAAASAGEAPTVRSALEEAVLEPGGGMKIESEFSMKSAPA